VSYDEKTTEIEIPGISTKANNIVRIDFSSTGQKNAQVSQAVTPTAPIPITRAHSQWDITSPWVLRLIAIFAILLLSLLVL